MAGYLCAPQWCRQINRYYFAIAVYKLCMVICFGRKQPPDQGQVRRGVVRQFRFQVGWAGHFFKIHNRARVCQPLDDVSGFTPGTIRIPKITRLPHHWVEERRNLRPSLTWSSPGFAPLRLCPAPANRHTCARWGFAANRVLDAGLPVRQAWCVCARFLLRIACQTR